jgi:hypothetical protein
VTHILHLDGPGTPHVVIGPRPRLSSPALTIASTKSDAEKGADGGPVSRSNDPFKTINDSQAIIYSIGSLYTSIIPAIILRGVGKSIVSSPAPQNDGRDDRCVERSNAVYNGLRVVYCFQHSWIRGTSAGSNKRLSGHYIQHWISLHIDHPCHHSARRRLYQMRVILELKSSFSVLLNLIFLLRRVAREPGR